MSLTAFGACVAREARIPWGERGGYALRGASASMVLVGAALLWMSDWLQGGPHRVRAAHEAWCQIQYLATSILSALVCARAVTREQEQGSLDLLLMVPGARMAILSGKIVGSLAGVGALWAGTTVCMLPVLPLGGISLPEIMAAQAYLMGHAIWVGALAALLAAFLGNLAGSAGLASVLVLIMAAAPDWARAASFGPGWVWSSWEAFSTWSMLQTQLGAVLPLWRGAAALAGPGLLALFLGAGLGSFVLEQRTLRRSGAGRRAPWRDRPRWAWVGRRILDWKDPLLRREMQGEPVTWGLAALLLPAYALLVQTVAGSEAVAQEALAAGGILGALLIVSVSACLRLSAECRRGLLSAVLLAGVPPERVIRCKATAVAARIWSWGILPALHLTYVLAHSSLVQGWRTAWWVVGSLTAFTLGSGAAAVVILNSALRFRRPEVGGLFAAALGTGAMGASYALMSASPVSAVFGFPALLAYIAWSRARMQWRLPAWAHR